jgi:hypothetical protein
VVPVVGFSLGYPDEDPPLRDRLPLEALVHRETYRDDAPEEIQAHYNEKEVKGIARYLDSPELRSFIEMSGAENLAQIYTKVKYTRESHLQYSETVLNYLKAQGFMEDV